jgi:hypothetical protein
MESEVASVRLKKGTVQRLKRLGINVSEETRRFLEELAWKTDARKTMEEIENIIKEKSKPSKSGFAVKSVREDRDETH